MNNYDFEVIYGLINSKKLPIIYEMNKEDVYKTALKNLILEEIIELIGLYQSGKMNRDFIAELTKF